MPDRKSGKNGRSRRPVRRSACKKGGGLRKDLDNRFIAVAVLPLFRAFENEYITPRPASIVKEGSSPWKEIVRSVSLVLLGVGIGQIISGVWLWLRHRHDDEEVTDDHA